jgi:ribonuclease P protein subunit RPR2
MWALWLLLAIGGYVALAVFAAWFLARLFGILREEKPVLPAAAAAAEGARGSDPATTIFAPPIGLARLDRRALPSRPRILIVDDDAGLRLLLRTTLAADEFDVQEASSAEEASDVARFWQPTLIVLDVGLPGASGLAFARELKSKHLFGAPTVILLTGADTSAREAEDAGADALLRKPFSPLELVSLIDRLHLGGAEPIIEREPIDAEQAVVYARDLSRLLQIERAQRRLLQQAYRQTVTALADALEAKDPATGMHALRVQRYALELTEAFDPSLLDDPSLEYGFLLHDIGKIAIPDPILNKPGPLSQNELQIVHRHPLIGAEMLRDVALLSGEGLSVVRSHHERWDGRGYPDGLTEEEIPRGARIFALADALDAMTSERPYRSAFTWDEAVDEILAQDGSQFDPRVVSAFALREPKLRRIRYELGKHAA